MRTQNRFRRWSHLPVSHFTALLCATISSLAIAQNDNQPPQGFTALFNGRDIADWTGGATRDPREIAALPPDQRAAWDTEMKRGTKNHWRVEDGTLISDGKDPFLATTRDYGDFELWVDWMIGPRGDSGIYLRGTPQVQIWDPTNESAIEHGADRGSGALWNNKKHERFPSELADKPIGAWNRMFVRMVGPYVTVELNDKRVVDNVVMENYYKPELPVYMRGPVYLQTHGAETRFRNVFVREIPTDEANRLLAEILGDESQFESVFNGKDFAGWTGAKDEYEIVGGALRCKSDHHGNLFTKDSYDNFVLRLEFKLPPGGNNGIGLRTPEPSTGDLAYTAMEVQVLDDAAPQYADLKDYQVHGSLYGLAPAVRGYLRPAGEWNFEEISLDGDQLIVRLNGFEILNVDIAKVRQKPVDGQQHPGASRTSGHIALCGHQDPVAFRNIRVKRLPPD
jgi:hypothetical protein